MSENKKNIVQEPIISYSSAKEAEEQRLRKDIFRPDMEKLQLFTKMLRTNALFKRAKITHK